MRKRTTVISLRIENDILDAIEKAVEAGDYKNTTDAIKKLLAKGQELTKLLKIAKNPDTKKEFYSKFRTILEAADIDQAMDELDIETLKLIRSISSQKIEKEFTKLLMQVKSNS